MSHSAGFAGGVHGHHATEYGEEDFAPIDPRVLRRFFAYVVPYRARLVVSLIAVGLFVITQVAVPLTIRSAVDSAVGRSSEPLPFVLTLFGGAVLLNAAFHFIQEWVTARLAQRVIFDLRRAMFAHLQDVSLSFLDQTQVGRLMSRLQGDVNALQEFVEQSVSAIGDLFLLIGIIVILLSMNWRLGLLTLSVLPVLVAIRTVWLPWARRKFWRARNASSAVNAALAENINGIRTVQESRREELNFTRYEVKANENLQAQIGSAFASQLMVPTVDVLTGVAMAIVVLVGGNAVLSGTLGVGSMVAFIFYVQRFFDPIRTLSMQYTVLQRAVSAGHRIFEVLDVPISIEDKPDAIILHDIVPSVEFRHVTFGFRPGQAVLKDINLRIDPYQTVALVGATGSGKTTITALARRFYDVLEGSVLVGGHDVRNVTLDSLGQSIAMVLQEPFLFTGTILENIRYHTTATRDDVIAAAKAVSAHGFIVRQPDGYDTQLGQRGRNLSIGQRQLISFARALVANPRILILDEATANIDSFTEQAIQNAMKVLLKGRTSIVIAHRLATIRDADRIIVLHQGRIVEQGTHDELLQRRGLYRQLHASAAGSFDDLPLDAQAGAG
jgi:ATP-binding cassette subfamily B protein